MAGIVGQAAEYLQLLTHHVIGEPYTVGAPRNLSLLLLLVRGPQLATLQRFLYFNVTLNVFLLLLISFLVLNLQ